MAVQGLCSRCRWFASSYWINLSLMVSGPCIPAVSLFPNIQGRWETGKTKKPLSRRDSFERPISRYTGRNKIFRGKARLLWLKQKKELYT
jgi:hypothetical protein